ncbi:hypothetical protein PGUG_05181 [Paecilomyces variotii No. 5]|uniref:C6 finger domain protein n=1 Tax=Byssochlamys spectabilis (strain No. 5 / NBRC 109023) TaxID=1356009 RepID=V5FFN3_BYSSN|nr:hypothetical protein PGUG_05181 [Paecilomyces variotii No. 5]
MRASGSIDLPDFTDNGTDKPPSGSLEVELEPTPTRPGSVSGSESSITRNVIVQSEDNELIQHYLNVMSNYTRIRRSRDENLYGLIFSNMALFYAPLYNAIMAWTGLHLSQSRPGWAREAETRHDYAVSLLYADGHISQHFELSIVTIWFLLQFELLAAKGVGAFCQHLDYAADLVEAHRRYRRGEGRAPSLGPVGARVLVWLGSYDARAAYAGSAGRLLQNLEMFCMHYDFIESAFSDTATENGAADLKPCLRFVLELDTVESRISQLHRKGGAVPVAIWSSIQNDLVELRERLECDPATAPAVHAVSDPTRSLGGILSTKRFNWLLLLASLYSVIISYHRMIPPEVACIVPKNFISEGDSAARIIRMALWVHQSRRPSPQNVWSRILFLAGIATSDLVYQDWVVKTLAEAETWGMNFHKTRLLLQHVIETQNREGIRADFLDIMRQTTGLFII